MPRPIRALIDPHAVFHNIQTLKNVTPEAKCMAIVKADAYGHGIERVISGLQAADMLGLLEIEAAARLRRLDWDRAILLLEGCFDSADVKSALILGCDWVIHDFSHFDLLKANAEAILKSPFKPTLYLKLNTGMNRLGFSELEMAHAIDRLEVFVDKLGLPEPVLMTHFANSDAPDLKKAALAPQIQFERLQAVNRAGWKSSLGNSAAVLNCPECAGDILRPGIAIYGATPGPKSAKDYGLIPAMSLQSEIIGIQDIKKGEVVGYGSRWVAERDTRIGIVACGYADGYPRHAPDDTPVMVDGEKLNLAGRVSMDMLTVNLGQNSHHKIGSPVELWGKDLPVDEVAQACGTIGYELLCAVTPRVPYVVEV